MNIGQNDRSDGKRKSASGLARVSWVLIVCWVWAGGLPALAGEVEVRVGGSYFIFDDGPHSFLPIDDSLGVNASVGYVFGNTGVHLTFDYIPNISDVSSPSIEVDQYLGGVELTHEFIIWSDVFVPYVSIGGGISYWAISEVFDDGIGGFVEAGGGLRVFPFDRRTALGGVFGQFGGRFIAMFNAVGNNDLGISTRPTEYFGGAADFSLGVRF